MHAILCYFFSLENIINAEFTPRSENFNNLSLCIKLSESRSQVDSVKLLRLNKNSERDTHLPHFIPGQQGTLLQLTIWSQF